MRITTLSVLVASLTACAKHSGVAIAPDHSAAAISRVTTGLRQNIVVKGASVTTFALADRMAHYKVPGVSIAVVNDGRIVWSQGFGVREAGTTGAVSSTKRFQAASISKPVAATAMLRLVEQNRLALDTPVNQYLKSWRVPDNSFTATEKVTLRRLVSHSAEFGVHGFPGYASDDTVPTVPQILDGTKPANTSAVRVESVPGSAFSYSGGGITIELLAMTDVTGESFPALMRRLVFDPIGMTESAYEQPLSNAKASRAAAGHRPDGTLVKGRWHTYPELAAAGLWTTPTDLLKWAMAITNARAGMPHSILLK